MKRICAIAVAASLLITACSRPEDKYVGTWTGALTYDTEKAETLLASLPATARETVMNNVNTLRIAVNLHEDGTYSLEYDNAAGQGTAEGTWTLAEDESSVTLSAPKLGDSDVDSFLAGILGNQDLAFTLAEGKKQMARSEEVLSVPVTLTFAKDIK